MSHYCSIREHPKGAIIGTCDFAWIWWSLGQYCKMTNQDLIKILTPLLYYNRQRTDIYDLLLSTIVFDAILCDGWFLLTKLSFCWQITICKDFTFKGWFWSSSALLMWKYRNISFLKLYSLQIWCCKFQIKIQLIQIFHFIVSQRFCILLIMRLDQGKSWN